MSYAQGTSVPVERSISELRSIVEKHGADGFLFAEEQSPPRAMVAFRIEGVHVRLLLPLPLPGDVSSTASGRPRSQGAVAQALADERRRRWRALVLVTKAKLEAAANGISTLEREFLADLVLPNGRSVHQEIAPRLAEWAESRQPVALIPEKL